MTAHTPLEPWQTLLAASPVLLALAGMFWNIVVKGKQLPPRKSR